MIIAGVSLSAITGDDGVLTKTIETKKAAEIADITEQIQREIVAERQQNRGAISDASLITILKKYATDLIEDEDGSIKEIITKTGNYTIAMADIWDVKTKNQILTDGSWTGTVNSPKIEGTGLTAVYWNGTDWTELTTISSTEEWSKWYDYSNQNWANAKSKDGSMWVWIPRFEYKIDSENSIISVNFINIGSLTTDSYTLHPAFTTDIENGGWRTELPGFWMAKYAAGFQNSTVGEETKTVQYSNLKYTAKDTYTSNFLEETLIVNETKLSYPVFKANTYAYNIISVGDSFLLSKEIDTAAMYGLSNVDSHLQKNSEWGAAAYLTHSKYGVNGNSTNMNEVTRNSLTVYNSIYVNNATSGNKANVCMVTGYGSKRNDPTASSTKNMTGVFDMNGGLYQRTAGFRKGGITTYTGGMATSTITESTEYMTLYTANDKYGDATNETTAWNSDKSEFTSSSLPIITRAGYSGTDIASAGIFATRVSSGLPYYNHGFRVCLAF